MARIAGSIAIPSSHPRFEEIRTAVGAKGTESVLIPPTYPGFEALRASLQPNGAGSTPTAPPAEPFTKEAKRARVAAAMTARENALSAQRDYDAVKALLEQTHAALRKANDDYATVMRPFGEVVPNGATFVYAGEKWTHVRGTLCPVAVDNDLDFDAPEPAPAQAEPAPPAQAEPAPAPAAQAEPAPAAQEPAKGGKRGK